MHTVSVSIPLTIKLSLDSPTVVADLVSDDLVVPVKSTKVVSVDMGHAVDPIKAAPAKSKRKPSKRAAKPAKAKVPKTVRERISEGVEIGRPARAHEVNNVQLATVIAVRDGAEQFGEILAKTGAKKSSQRVALARLKKSGQLFSAGQKADMVYGVSQAQADKRYENRKASAAQVKQLKAA